MLYEAILIFCNDLVGPSGAQQRRACFKTYQAVDKKYGIDRALDRQARPLARDIETVVDDTIGLEIVGAAAAGHRIWRKKQIGFTTSKIPYVQNTGVTLGILSIHVKMGWGF